MADEVDVAIVGGGVAGIAAGQRLTRDGHSVLVIEALERLGGRAHTTVVDGFALDLGCGWLHSAERNPLVAMAERMGMVVDRSESAWEGQFHDLGFSPADQEAASQAYAAFQARVHDAPPPSDRAGDLIAHDDPWRPYADAISGYVNGAELDRLSVADFLAYDDAATACNWRLPGGYGTLIARAGEGLAVSLGTQVRAIDHSGSIVRIETDRGPVRARAAIVAVPTPILAAGAIRFTPALDGHLHAAAQLPLGLADKVYFRLARPEAVPPESHLLGNPRRAETGSYYLRPFGRPLVECFFGGRGARMLEKAGPHAAEAFAREELGALLGSDLAGGLVPLIGTAWGKEPTILGSYSHAIPGGAGARAILATPPSERLVFAGEACSQHDFSTAHGAWQSGIHAAEQIGAALR